MTEGNTRRIQINNAEPPTVDVFLKYVYTGELEVEDVDDAAVIILADFYQAQALLIACAEVAVNTMTPDTVSPIVRALRCTREGNDAKHVWDAIVSKCGQDASLLSAALFNL